MGKTELENIKKLHKVRSYQRGKAGYTALLIIAFLFAELNWLIDFLHMYITGKNYGEIVWGSGITGIMTFVAVIVTFVCTFFDGLYKENISVFPQNNVTAYVSHWIITLKYGGFFALMAGVLSVVGYGMACIVEKISGKLSLINVISVKYFVIMTIYMLTYFILFDAVIKLAGVIFRKSRLVTVGIIVVIVAVAYIRMKTRTSFMIANFFVKEENFAVFEGKAIITALICFILGYVLELKIKNSKSEISGNKNNGMSKVMMFILGYMFIVAVIMFTGFMTNSNGWEVSKTITTTEYKLELPAEKTKYKLYTDDSTELFYKGIQSLKVKKGKEPKIVVEKYEIDNENSQIKDVFRDLEFEVTFKDGKIYIDNKNFKGVYLYMSVAGLSNAQLQSFMGNDIIYCDFDDELIENYLSQYEITIYLPEEYLEEKISLEY